MSFTVQVELDKDVFERLQQLAKPFVDTPSSVIRHLLQYAETPIRQEGGASRPEREKTKLTLGRTYTTSRGVRLPLVHLRAAYHRRGNPKTHRFEADITPEGIKFDGKLFDDPSPAGIRAKELAGAVGAAASTNGWEFWEYFDESQGKWTSIDVFRKRASVPNLTLEDLEL